MRRLVTEKDETLTVKRQFRAGKKVLIDNEETEVVDVHRFLTAPGEVGLSGGMTLNLGDFESARVDIHWKVPAYVEEMEEAYKYAGRAVRERLKVELEEIRDYVATKTIPA